jgi:hypothetical protein
MIRPASSLSGSHYTVMISFSLAATTLSTCSTYLLTKSWRFGFHTFAHVFGQPVFHGFFDVHRAPCGGRCARLTLLSSPACLAFLTNSLRRSSVSGGMDRRIISPSLDGVMPILLVNYNPFDRPEHISFPRAESHDRARIGDLHIGYLGQRRWRSVVFHVKILNNRHVDALPVRSLASS